MSVAPHFLRQPDTVVAAVVAAAPREKLLSEHNARASIALAKIVAAEPAMRQAWLDLHPGEPLPEHLCALDNPSPGQEQWCAEANKFINEWQRTVAAAPTGECSPVEPVPDTQAAIDFLKQRPGFPVLSCAWVDPVTGKKGLFETQSFPALDWANVAKWIDKRQGKGNLYYSVNPAIAAKDSKLEREDIASLVSLHVDLDPRLNEAQADAQIRIVKQLSELKQPPTWVIASGGGVQGIWDLVDPVPIDGKAAVYEDLKLYNVKLEQDLGGDHCHNIDRIMRLPGTINIPDARKMKKGRKAALAYVVAHNATDYKIDDFAKAAALKDDAPPGGAAPRGAASGKKAAPIDRNKVVIKQVDDFDTARVSDLGHLIREYAGDLAELNALRVDIDSNKKPYASNSDMGHAYIFTLVAAGYSNEEIAGDVFDANNPAGIHYRELPLKNRLRGVGRSITDARDAQALTKHQNETGVVFPDGVHPQTFVPHALYGNAVAAFDELKLECRKDVFRDKVFVGSRSIEELAGGLTDDSMSVIQDAIYKRYKFYPKEEHVKKILVVRALENKFDPVLDTINALVWDGAPRLDKWLSVYMGATSSPYVDAVGRKTLIGAIRRLRDPGCKLDSTLALEGEQEKGKSLMCSDLAGADDLFTDSSVLTRDAKEQQELLTGKWVHEIAELEGMSRADLEQVKAFLTRRFDRGRPAYARFVVDRPRRFFSIATTNKQHYLNDTSGNRRWWPVAITGYDREAFLRDRDQLLAEAAHYEATGESLYLPAELKAVAKDEQAARMVQDGWADLLATTYGYAHGIGKEREERIASTKLLLDVLKLPAEKHNNAALNRLGHVMRGLGWNGPNPMRIGSGVARGYCRPLRPETLGLVL